MNSPHSRNNLLVVITAVLLAVIFYLGLTLFETKFATGIVFAFALFIVSFIDIRAGFVIIILSTLLSPEIRIPTTYFREISLRLEDFLLIVVFFAWLGRLAIKQEYRNIRFTPIDLPVFLIIVVNIISTVRGVLLGEVTSIPMAFFYNLKVLEFVAIYFIISNGLRNKKEVKFFLTFVLITAIVVALYSLPQIPKTEIFSIRRLTAPFEGTPEPNTLGGYLMIILAVSICLWLYMKQSGLRFWCGALIFLIFIPLLFTLSRGAYVATFGMLFFIGLLSRKKWILIALFIFILLSPFILPQAVIDRALYNFKDPRYWGFADPSIAERIYSFRKAYYYLKTAPLLGHGITGGGNILDNQYSRIAIETGLIGLFLFFWMIKRMFKVSWFVFKKSEIGWIKGLSLAYVCALFGLLIHSLGNISFYIVRIMEPFWILTAFVVVLYKEMVYEGGTEEEKNIREG